MPLYAVEVVRGLLTDGRIERRGDVYEPVGDLSTITVPESLRSLIASRLDGLDPADRALLQDASVVGQVFATDALSAVSGVATDELEPRLRDLARRELLDVERDPKSPERGPVQVHAVAHPRGRVRHPRPPRSTRAAPRRGEPLRSARRR